MLNNQDQFKAAFIPYLQQFVQQAQLETPELAQVPVPPELGHICQNLGITFKTSFGMGLPTVIPWLACFYPGQTASQRGESLPGPSPSRWMSCWQPRKKICWQARGATDVGAGKRQANVGEVAAALKYRYADFSHYNLKDPLDELLFIIFSTKTEEASYRSKNGACSNTYLTFFRRDRSFTHQEKSSP